MKNQPIFFLLSLLLIFSCDMDNDKKYTPKYDSFEDYPVYDGDDLGYQFSPAKTTFKLWSPNVEAVRTLLYNKDIDGRIIGTYPMIVDEKGVWELTLNENLEGKFYTYQIKNGGDWISDAADPYSIACGRNGRATQIVDMKKTDPDGWENDKRPPLATPNDMVIYELHVRDVSISKNSGIQQKGKFLGLVETGSLSPDGLATGIDHMKAMGITHVHIMPAFDFRSIDETKSEEKRNYNWGYDPHLYNVPEGTYATDPADGAVRIKEFKKMVKGFHEAGIRVVLDVVYNHTGSPRRSVFDRLVPDYYFRFNENGKRSDASACGNETASERPMVRNFILHSVRHWVEEYHIDGFRFDLMGIHDIETMNQITKTLQAIDPTIFVYGEGWTAGDSPLPESERAIKANGQKLDQAALFSDDIRDGLKGHVFTHDAKAFISGAAGLEESVKFGIVGATQHPQVDYDTVNYSNAPWAKQPAQCINYVSCHDNHTLYDRLTISCPNASEEDKRKMGQLALGTILTSQGIPFLHAGSEFLRTKNGVENSFESPDSINAMDWARKKEYLETVDFVKDMIALRKAHPAFKMKTQADIATNLQFGMVKENLITYTLDGEKVGDDWKKIQVILNGNANAQNVTIPSGNWKVIVQNGKVNEKGLRTFAGNNFKVDAIDIVVLAQENTEKI
ncbi:MAG: type I pullulanase [Bacteroidota bacterium]